MPSSAPSPRRPRPPRLVVVGSLNVDLIARVARLPAPGETVSGLRLLRRFGGKGANQAVAAARQGATVSFIGCLGDDADGRAYAAHLRREGIGIAGVHRVPRQPTGAALIAVDARAENTIICVPGANGTLTGAQVSAHRGRISAADRLLLQWEVPAPAVLAAIRIANGAGVPVLMNPSPWRPGFPWGRVRIDTLVVNENEARELFGGDAGTPLRLGSRLAAFGLTRLVITRGARTTLAITEGDVAEIPTLPVTPVDTVGAGDAFAGACAAYLAAGCRFEDALARANAAGAAATLKPGAQEAIPTRRAVERLLRRNKGSMQDGEVP
jgi:ribokinase